MRCFLSHCSLLQVLPNCEGSYYNVPLLIIFERPCIFDKIMLFDAEEEVLYAIGKNQFLLFLSGANLIIISMN